MEVTIPLFAKQLCDGYGIEDIRKVYAKTYAGPIVTYVDGMYQDGFVSAHSMAGKDGMQISVFGNEDRILLCAVYDNLGKGASGAAIQCMNMVLGIDKTTGLVL